MKNRSLLKLSALFLFLSMFSCEDQELIIIEDSQPDRPMEQDVIVPQGNSAYVAPGDIPEVMGVLAEYTATTDLSAKGISYRKANILTDRILKIRGKKGKANHTFEIMVEDQPEGEFYNLIIHRDSTGRMDKPFVRRYMVADHALEAYVQSGYDFKFFEGTWHNYTFEEFFNRTSADKGALQKASPECGDGGAIGGGSDPIENPNLIDINNDITWNGMGQLGYTRPLGGWNDYGGTGGYELEVQVQNVPENTNERASQPNVQANYVGIFTGSQTMSTNLLTDFYLSITTYIPPAGSGGPCSTTIFQRMNGVYTINTYYFTCGGPPVQQKGAQITARTGDCPEADGEIGVVDSRSMTFITKALGFGIGTAEYEFLRTNPDKFDEVKAFLNANKVDGRYTAEAKLFAILAVKAFMKRGSVDFEYRIINTLTGKAKCGYEMLTKKGGTNFVTNILEDFKGLKSEVNLDIKSKESIYHKGRLVNGITRAKVINGKVSDITIEISTSQSNANPMLAVAKTVMHEVIHAGMIRALYAKDIGPMGSNFKETYNIYKSKIFQADPQHNTMAELYIDKMASTLKAIHKGAMTGDYNYLSNNGTKSLDDFYEALAWQGLKIDDEEAWRTMPPGRQKALNDALAQSYGATTKSCPN